MNSKPLTPNHINQFSKTLQKAGVKSSVLEIFFDSIIELIDPYNHNVTQNIEDILAECNFASMDDINAFLLAYNNFTNSAISFIDSYDLIEDNNVFEQEAQPLFEALYLESQSRDSYQILLKSIDKIVVKTIEVYEIDTVVLSENDDVTDYLTDILGKDAALVMLVLMTIAVVMHEDDVDRDDLEILRANFMLANSFIHLLNGLRKEALDDIESNKHFVPRSLKEDIVKVGRNDPCPCGSGKKYKKCCINKQDEKKINPLDALDLPMATHFPLSERDINDFYAIWTRLVDFTSKLFCQMKGKKYKKLYRKDKEGKYHFNDEILKDNYYMHLRDFLLTNFHRIIDDFIASSRVSKVNQEILQEWKSYRLRRDDFFIYEQLPYGALVWDVSDGQYYYVYDLYDSLYEISVKETPLSMLLLPFKGRIIYDGVIGRSNLDLGQNAKDMFLKDYVTLREEKDVSFSLPAQSSTTKIYQLKISIKGAKPPIWRRILIEDDMTYKSMHMIIQDIFDWYDGHLHMFYVNGKRYTDLEFDDGFADDLGEDERKFVLSDDLKEVNDKIMYLYDFGDSWEHEIKLEAVLEKDEDRHYPKCIKGKGRGPLEDIGGIWAYNTIVNAYKTGDKETLDDFYVDDDFDPNKFDLHEINSILGG